jgi:acetylxylan esterase
MVSKTSRAVLAFAAVANAQVPVWGQCGGIGYGGSTVCAPGAACSTFNDWYCKQELCIYALLQRLTT